MEGQGVEHEMSERQAQGRNGEAPHQRGGGGEGRHASRQGLGFVGLQRHH